MADNIPAKADQNQRVDKLIRDAVETGRFLICVTVLREGGKLEHFVEWRNFPVEDLMRSQHRHKEMITERLERDGEYKIDSEGMAIN